MGQYSDERTHVYLRADMIVMNLVRSGLSKVRIHDKGINK